MGFKTGVYIANLQTCTSPTSPLPMCSSASLPCLSSFRWARVMINLIPILIVHCPQAILLQRWHLPPFLCRFCPTITVLSVNVSVLTLVTMLFLFLLESLYFNYKPRLWSASIATAQSSILWVPAAASPPLGRMSKTPCCENCFHTCSSVTQIYQVFLNVMLIVGCRKLFNFVIFGNIHLINEMM